VHIEAAIHKGLPFHHDSTNRGAFGEAANGDGTGMTNQIFQNQGMSGEAAERPK
jgi:hypothetical protein